MEKQLEKHFAQQVHRNVISPLRRKPLVKIINQDQGLDDGLCVFDVFENKFEGLEKIEVVESAWKRTGLVLGQAVEVALYHGNCAQDLGLAEGIRLLYDDRHHYVY